MGFEATLQRLWGEVSESPRSGATTTSSPWAGTRSSASRWWRGRGRRGSNFGPGPVLRAPDRGRPRRRPGRRGAPAAEPAEPANAPDAATAVTPGDFPLAGMDAAGLGRLFEQIAALDLQDETNAEENG